MQPGERDLGGAREVELVGLERVDVRPVGREEAGAVHRLLAHEHGRQHRREPVRNRAVEREAVERQREERGVADQEAEARARQARGALELEAADLRCASWPARAGLPQRRSSSTRRSSGRDASRSGLVGAGWHRGEPLRRVALGLGGDTKLSSTVRSNPLTSARSASWSGVGLPLMFCLARSSSTCGTSARQRSSAASIASNASAAPLRASAMRKRSGSARAARRSIIRVSLEGLRARERRPPRRRAGRPSRPPPSRARARSRPRSRSRPTRAARRRSRRRRRRSSAHARSRGARRGSRAPSPSRRRAFANSRNFGSDFVTHSRSPKRAHPLADRVELVGVADADDLRRRLGQPRLDVADLVDRDQLEVRVRLGSRRDSRDVELVADVDVRVVPLRLDGGDRLPASSSSIGTCRSHSPSASTTAAPW